MGLLFAMPWILGFAVFVGWPVFASLFFSMTDYSVLTHPKWVGLSNYAELAHDDVFYTTLKNTLFYVAGAVPLTTVIAIILALLLNTKVRGMAFYRTIFFLPSLVPMVALATLFHWIFDGEYGLLNAMLKFLHITGPNWMGDPAWAKWTLILISMWGCGQAMVIYLAGLQDVPISLYEAADLDGAKTLSKIRNVTLPMISPVILFNAVMAVIGSLQIFAIPYVMFDNGSPAHSTYFLTAYLYDNAYSYHRMGYASAMGWVMFLITLVLTALAMKLSERHVHYEGG